MRNQSGGFLTILMFLLVFGGFGFLLYTNARPVEPLRAIVPTQVEPTSAISAWQEVLRPGFGNNSTPLPTIAIPDQPFAAPTLPPVTPQEETPFAASELISQDLFTLEPISMGITPTPAPTIEILAATNSPQVQPVALAPTIPWQAPPLPVPQNRDPMGRDHYIFARPIDSSGHNFGIPYYPYGSDGQEFANPLGIHHGIDMPNPVGAPVRATGSGRVVFASTVENPIFQNSASYGNVVAIEHDFGWNGQPLYTVYAHLEAALVRTGDYVETGDAIGINGNSGRASGPHVHFEVRVGQNTYGSTYNPVLWMVPYVGHGTVAGNLLDERGNRLDGWTVTLRDWGTGLLVSNTKTYIFLNTVNDVNSDPNWAENFVFGDVPAGRYEVVATYEGQRISSNVIEVREGMTTFVELQPREAATPQPVPTTP